MNLSGFISRRYLFSKNNKNAINIISGISVVGFAVGSMALVVVLSVFNGFESLVISLYNSFDPDIKVLPAEGKVFYPDSVKHVLQSVDGVLHITEVLEENAALKYDDKQTIATIKGVSTDYARYSKLDSFLVEGSMVLSENNVPYAVMGYGLAHHLSVSTDNDFTSLAVFIPRRSDVTTLTPEEGLVRRSIMPAGIFSVEEEINDKYVLVPISFARELLEYDSSEVSAIEILLKPGADMEKVQDEIQNALGPGFAVKNRYQLQEVLYRVFNTERWATYFILTFILLIAAFNVIGSLTMLVIDKKRDISVMKSLGATDGLIRSIFLKEGLLIALIGAVAGIALGIGICWAQQEYGLVKLGGGSFVINDYPVKMKWTDIVLVFFTTMFLGVVTSFYPSLKSARQEMYWGK